MKKIIIGFSKPNNKFAIMSLLVRLYQWTSFSHTYIKLLTKGSLPSNKILHASDGFVQNVSETQFTNKNIKIEEFEIEIPDIIVFDKLKNTSSSLYYALVSIMHETSGDTYSYIQNLGILYVKFMKFFGKKVDNPWKLGWNCSEFVFSILSIIYPKEFSKKDPNTITPKQIYKLLKKLDKNPNYKIRRITDG